METDKTKLYLDINADTARRLSEEYAASKQNQLSRLIDIVCQRVMWVWNETISNNIRNSATKGRNKQMVLVTHYFDRDFYRQLGLLRSGVDKFSEEEVTALLATQLRVLIEERGFGYERLNADLIPDPEGLNLEIKW